MTLPLEDAFEDVVMKAAKGLGVAVGTLPRDEAQIRALARSLELHADALVESAARAWTPGPVPPLTGLAMFTTPFRDMTVNSYVAWDPATGRAAAFDTGADCGGMLELGVGIEAVFLTHIHGDHVFELDRLLERTGARAFVSAREPIEGATPFADGEHFGIGALRVTALRTSGHARGGTTFLVEGLERPLAIVGDALFAGSMGGAPQAYREALETARAAIFTLPDETLLCPGHGPLTTVREEKLHNPFFATA
jgi:glyoxylase-like metal-dependent hydrolase (beta-lactamase superfamily II)